MLFFYTNEEQMGNAQLGFVLFCLQELDGILKCWSRETFRSIYLTFSTMALECQHADFSHFWIQTPHFQLEQSFIVRWDYGDIRESAVWASSPACKGAPRAGVSEHSSATAVPYSLFFLVFFIPPGSPSLRFLKSCVFFFPLCKTIK